MAKNKTKRIKEVAYQSEDQNEIKRFIIILVVVILAILLVYLFTRIFVSKDLFNKEETKQTTPGSINYSTTLIGSMLNINAEEYYVMLTDTSITSSVYYTGLVSTYKRNTDALPIYIADLSNELNKNYISKTSNLETDDITEFKVTDTTLLKIKNGKIVNSYTTDEEMIEQLKYVSETTN